MKDDEAESKAAIEQAFASAGLKVPALKEVLLGLKIDLGRAQKIVTLLLRDKILVKVTEDLVFHRAALTDLRQRLIAEKVQSAKIDVGRFKELTGVSRKYAIPLLEYLDREHVTRRVGNDRVNSVDSYTTTEGTKVHEGNALTLPVLGSALNLFFGELYFQAQRIGEAIGQIRQSGYQKCRMYRRSPHPEKWALRVHLEVGIAHAVPGCRSAFLGVG